MAFYFVLKTAFTEFNFQHKHDEWAECATGKGRANTREGSIKFCLRLNVTLWKGQRVMQFIALCLARVFSRTRTRDIERECSGGSVRSGNPRVGWSEKCAQRGFAIRPLSQIAIKVNLFPALRGNVKIAESAALSRNFGYAKSALFYALFMQCRFADLAWIT